MMNAAAPDGTPPRRINATINFLPAVPRRGPEAGVHRIENNFHNLGENTLFMLVSTEQIFLKIKYLHQRFQSFGDSGMDSFFRRLFSHS